jgi:sulfur carrier protein
MTTDTGMVKVRVNDVERSYPRPTTLAELVRAQTQRSFGCAAAVNGVVVRRGEWESREVEDGDTVEILAPQPGG